MTATLLLEGGESTYNIDVPVVQESEPLTTASQQYWAKRVASSSTEAARMQEEASASTAEQDWTKYCAANTRFLNRLLSRALDRIEKPLRLHWGGNKTLSKDARRLFGNGAAIELLIPFAHVPLRFVVVSPNSSELRIRTSDSPDHVRAFELGKPYVSISWEGKSGCSAKTDRTAGASGHGGYRAAEQGDCAPAAESSEA